MFPVCREVLDDIGRLTSTAEPSAAGLPHQPSQCPVHSVISIPNHLCHSSQFHLGGAPLKHTAVQQPANTVFTSLPSNVPSSVRQADDSTGLLVKLQQLVESCGLSDQAASSLMDWFTQELHSISHTLGLPSEQESGHAASVHVSSASNGATGGTSELCPLEMRCTQNNTGELLSASVVSAPMPATLCSQEAFHLSAEAASAERAATQSFNGQQYSTGELQPPLVTTSVDQLSSLAHLQQLQQMYLESASSALRNLCILQQQLVSAASTTADDALSTSSTAAGTPVLDAVYNQSSFDIPHSE